MRVGACLQHFWAVPSSPLFPFLACAYLASRLSQWKSWVSLVFSVSAHTNSACTQPHVCMSLLDSPQYFADFQRFGRDLMLWSSLLIILLRLLFASLFSSVSNSQNDLCLFSTNLQKEKVSVACELLSNKDNLQVAYTGEIMATECYFSGSKV